jgi:hypothetical protein
VATPLEHAKRAYAVFLRGPVPSYAFGFSLVDTFRAGLQHLGLMNVVPEPSDSMESDFGILVGGGFTVEITDEDGTADWFLLYENGNRILLEDGSGVLTLES